jgi:hypothetical protein
MALGALGTAALISGGATLVGNLPRIIPSKYEREQNKRLKELERRQEMGLLGLTERQEQQMQTQFTNTRDQAQRRQDAEMRRLSTPTAQPGQQMLGAQMSMDNRQRLEADIASQILGIDLKRQAEQEADIEALRAGQAQVRKDRTTALVEPFTSAGEAYIKGQTLERLIGQMPEEDKDMFIREDFAKRMTPQEQPINQSVVQQLSQAQGNPAMQDQILSQLIPDPKERAIILMNLQSMNSPGIGLPPHQGNTTQQFMFDSLY